MLNNQTEFNGQVRIGRFTKIIGMREVLRRNKGARWFLKLDGFEREISLSSVELLSYSDFNKQALMQANRDCLFSYMDKEDWWRLLYCAMGEFLGGPGRQDAALPVPHITGMHKCANPEGSVRWVVTLENCDGPLALSTDRLLSYSRFRRKAFLELHCLFALMKNREWDRLVARAMGEFLRREVHPCQ